VVSETRSIVLTLDFLSSAKTQTRSASAEVRELQDGLQTLHVVILGVQANMR